MAFQSSYIIKNTIVELCFDNMLLKRISSLNAEFKNNLANLFLRMMIFQLWDGRLWHTCQTAISFSYLSAAAWHRYFELATQYIHPGISCSRSLAWKNCHLVGIIFFIFRAMPLLFFVNLFTSKNTSSTYLFLTSTAGLLIFNLWLLELKKCCCYWCCTRVATLAKCYIPSNRQAKDRQC